MTLESFERVTQTEEKWSSDKRRWNSATLSTTNPTSNGKGLVRGLSFEINERERLWHCVLYAEDLVIVLPCLDPAAWNSSAKRVSNEMLGVQAG
jgi:hypothetical protein